MISSDVTNLRQLYARCNCAATDLMYLCIWAAVFPVFAFLLDSNPPALTTILVAFVFPVLVAMVSGAASRSTMGMRSEGLILTDLKSQPISFGRCALRILFGFVLSPLFPISAVAIILDPARGSLADRLLGTRMSPRPHPPKIARRWLPRDSALPLLARRPWEFVRTYRAVLIVLLIGATADVFTTLWNDRIYGAGVEVHPAQRWVQQLLGVEAGVPVAKIVQLVFVVFVASWWRPWCSWILLACGVFYAAASVSNYFLLF